MTIPSRIGIHIDHPRPWRRVRVVNEDTGKTAYAWSWWDWSLFRALDEVVDDH